MEKEQGRSRTHARSFRVRAEVRDSASRAFHVDREPPYLEELAVGVGQRSRIFDIAPVRRTVAEDPPDSRSRRRKHQKPGGSQEEGPTAASFPPTRYSLALICSTVPGHVVIFPVRGPL